MSLTSWTASGQPGSYAIWGNDVGGNTINGSAPLPDGTNGVYFGGGIMNPGDVDPVPTEAADGTVSFGYGPTIIPQSSTAPVTLEQTVSGLNTSSMYVLDFWTSGESVGSFVFSLDGVFGLDITGESLIYLSAPSGNGPIGNSQRYHVYFTPSASTVTFKWINWGHFRAPPFSTSDELVLDDVILNEVPEPGTMATMLMFGACLLFRGNKVKCC